MMVSRRRMIGILAATMLPLPGTAGVASGVRWQGQALGADASMALAHADENHAQMALETCHIELKRLERIFSLFQQNSAISRLNREGRLADAPAELIELLGIAERLSAISDGAFDITVQPLWQAFSRGGDCRAGHRACEKIGRLARCYRRWSIRQAGTERHGHHPERHRPGLYYGSHHRLFARGRLSACLGADGRIFRAWQACGWPALAGRHWPSE